MKKINSIWFGSKMIGLGIVFCAGIPLMLYGMSKMWPAVGIFMLSAKISISIGLLILAAFTVILVIELNQDRMINKNYSSKCRCKISPTAYECQNCGNKTVIEEDTYCRVCGIKFK